ncbi:MAG TPA: cytochrome P450 [Candidatus Binataceae bacterium]|nr:cytochrome P450 [Candidatus Binataceae bacterium]
MKADQICLNDPDFFLAGDYHAVLRELRQRDPVHWCQGKDGWDFWSLTRYEDCRMVYRQPERFCSARGIVLPAEPRVAGPNPVDYGNGLMLISTDPPRHNRVRKVVSNAFTPRAIGLREERFVAIADELIDEVAPRGQCDLVVDLAAQMPTAVICEMMGVPRPDWKYMIRLGNMSVGGTDPEYQVEGSMRATQRQALDEIFAYFGRLIDERRGKGGTDLVSMLANGEVDSERLSDQEALFNCFLLLNGGLETTRNAISGGILELMHHPGDCTDLRADPTLMPAAVEEVLRWTSPITHMMRTAVTDTEIRGRRIGNGQKVVMWNISANRDEEVFPEPYRFDIRRTPNDHLAFGYGEHFCLGASLARLELNVMLQQLLRRLPDLELAGEVQRLRSHIVAGIKHMPVRFTPTSRAAA